MLVVVPLTSTELKFGIHKSSSRTFFENEFFSLSNDKRFVGNEKYGTCKCEEENIVQVLEAVQKVRNEFLSNSANSDSEKLSWNDDSAIIPKPLAREAAKVASFFDDCDNQEIGDNLNPSFGKDLLTNLLREQRNIPTFKELYLWMNKRSDDKTLVLTQENHLLLYEILFDKAIESLKKK